MRSPPPFARCAFLAGVFLVRTKGGNLFMVVNFFSPLPEKVSKRQLGFETEKLCINELIFRWVSNIFTENEQEKGSKRFYTYISVCQQYYTYICMCISEILWKWISNSGNRNIGMENRNVIFRKSEKFEFFPVFN